jgi:hypothetical protein
MFDLTGINDMNSCFNEKTGQFIDPNFDRHDDRPWDYEFTADRARFISNRYNDKIKQFVGYWLFQIKKKAGEGKRSCSFKYFYKGGYAYQKESLNRLLELGYLVRSVKEPDGIRIIVTW